MLVNPNFIFNISIQLYRAKIPAQDAVYIDLILYSGIKTVYIDSKQRKGRKNIDIVKAKQRFIYICKTYIHRDGINDLLDWLEKSDFFYAPASTKFHGNYAGGLLVHSLNVYDCLKMLIKMNNITGISDETIAIVSLFHDICKANFYKVGTRNVKDEETGKWYKKEVYEIDDSTFPIGHGEKSCVILQWFLKKLSVDELLAIRHHMGGFDNAVKGGDYSMSRAYEMCKLAVLLHLADMNATYLLEESNG